MLNAAGNSGRPLRAGAAKPPPARSGGVLGRERGRRRQSGVLQGNPFGRNKSFRFLRCFQFVPNFVVGKDRIVPNQVRHAKEPPSTKCLASSDSNGIRIGGFIVRRRQANDTFLAEPATMLLRHAGDLEDQFRGICVFVHRRCAFAEGTARRGAWNVANVEVLPIPMLPVANAGLRLPQPTSGGLEAATRTGYGRRTSDHQTRFAPGMVSRRNGNLFT